MSAQLIAALDTADLDELTALATALGGEVDLLKVGLEAFAAHGPAAVAAAAEHAPVFLDLKLHDIPTTVAGAARAAAAHGAAMLTVHASGGPAMIAAAVAAAPGTTVLAVSVLTSLDDAALSAVGQPSAAEQVPRLADLAVEAGAGGLVCSAAEVAAVRARLGASPAVVVPGIRPAGAGTDDQARTATPEAAAVAGASHLVLGRALSRAADPAAAAREIRASLPSRSPTR
ncbi:MAG: orotidine-5'-phosphate decarboxylase [Egibacteraceae bacterium]